MENQIEIILTLAPLALMLVMRIVGSVKNNQQAQDRVNLARVLKADVAKTARKSRNVQAQAYKPAFQFEESAPPPIVHWDEKTQAKKIAVNKIQEPAAPDMVPMPEAPKDQESYPAHAVVRKDQGTEQSVPFPQLARLSPLQQAVIYAELLGPPKGFSP